jgi:hypothetical protein
MTMWRRLLLILSLVGLLGVLTAWWATGADLGWSKTQVQEMVVDELTGLEYPEWKSKLVLGIEFLVGGVLGSLALGAVALLWPKPKSTQPS